MLLLGLAPVLRASPDRKPASGAGETRIGIDATREHQTIEGFGATHRSGAVDGKDLLGERLRQRALEALYKEVRLTTGNLDAALLESPGSYNERRNDNDRPDVIDWSGFQTGVVDAMKRFVLDRPETASFTGYYLAQRINTRWASPWLGALKARDYERYLDEAAEQVVAGQTYWRDKHGVVPKYHQLFNEPLGGNNEVPEATRADLPNIVKRAGQRLREAGFGDVRFVVSNEVHAGYAYNSAKAILGDPEARVYVGAIGFHPYGDNFSVGRQALARADRGEADAETVAARARLRDLAREHGVQLWMTETSSNGFQGASYDAFRARAVHIHLELVHANVSVYMGMNSIWDSASHREHYGRTGGFEGAEGDIVMVDQASRSVTINGIGRAIGHYARWLTPGASVRLETSSSDPLVMATAFRDDTARRLVTVLLNNSSEARTIQLDITGLQVTGAFAGERSTRRSYWSPIRPDRTGTGATQVELPPESVTTLATPLGAPAAAGE